MLAFNGQNFFFSMFLGWVDGRKEGFKPLLKTA